MATAFTDQVQKVYIAYYGRAADPVGLAYWAAKVETDGLAGIMASFGASAEATTLYGGLSDTAMVNALYQQSFGRDADFAGLMHYAGELTAGRMTAATIAQNIFDGATGSDATILTNKLVVAKAYTAEINTASEVVAYSGTVAAASARALLSTVDAATVTTGFDVTTSVASIVTTSAATPAVAGTTFKLTASTDNIVGTAGADIVNSVFTADAATGTTIAPGDSFTGGAGVDTLNISVAGAATTAALATLSAVSLSGVEKLHLSNFETSANDHTIDTALMTGLTHVGLASSSATGDVGFTNLKNLVEADMMNGSGDVSVTYATSVVAGTADTQTLNLANASAGTFTAAGVETVAINTSLLASTIDAVTATAMSKMTVAGNQNLSIAKALDFAGTGTINGTVDASAFTGALTLNLSTAEVVSATGGSGADTFALAGTMTKADIVDGGTGADTVALTIGASTLDATAVTGELIGLSNVETLRLTSTDTTDASTIDLKAVANVTDVTVAGALSITPVESVSSADVISFTLNGKALTSTITDGTNATTVGTSIVSTINGANLGIVAVNTSGVITLTPTTAGAVKMSAFVNDTNAGRTLTSPTTAASDDHAMTLTNMTTQSATVLGGASNAAAATNAGVLSLALTDASGTADSMTVNLSADAQNKAVDHSLDGLTTTNVESLTLTSNGLSATKTQILDVLTGGTALTSLTISGSSNLTITDHSASNTKLATIDASAFTGNLTLSDAATLAQTITSGAGNDSFVFGAAGKLTNADTVDGGGNTVLSTGVMGTDKLSADVTGVTATTGALSVANVENLNLTNTGTALINAAGITGATQIAVTGAAGITTYSNLAEGATLALGFTDQSGAAVTGTTTLALADATATTNAVTVNLHEATSNTLKATSVETVNLAFSKTAAISEATTTLTVSALNAKTIKVTGADTDTSTILALGTLDTDTTTVDASGFKGVLTMAAGTATAMTVSANGKLANTITTSTGSDTVTLAGNLGLSQQDISGGTGTLDVLNVNADNAATNMTDVDGFETINLTVKASTAVGMLNTVNGISGLNAAKTVNVTGGNSLSSFSNGTTGVIAVNTAATTIDASAFQGKIALNAAASGLNSFLTIKGGDLTTDAVTMPVHTTAGTADKIASMTGVETLTLTGGNDTANNAVDLTNVTGLVNLVATMTAGQSHIHAKGVADGVKVKINSTTADDNVVIDQTNKAGAANTLDIEFGATAVTGALGAVDLDVAGIETLNIVNKDTGGVTLNLAGMVPTTGSTGTLNISGAGPTVLAGLNTGINVIDASGATGGLTILSANRDTDVYTITGGTGLDVITMENAADVLDGGVGTSDMLHISHTGILGGVSVDLSKTDVVVSMDGGTNSVVQKGFENVNLNLYAAFGAVVVGSDAANKVSGTPQVDSIQLGKGNDILSIVNTATAATDTVTGGAGTDTIHVDGLGSNGVATNMVDLTTLANGLVAGAAAFDLSTGFENIDLRDAIEEWTIRGSAGDNVIYGSLGVDLFHATAGNDTVTGGAGTVIDTFNFTEAFLLANSGTTSTYDGGAGVDIIKVEANTVSVVDADLRGFSNTETYLITSGINNVVLSTNASAAGINIVTGGAGVDTLNVAGMTNAVTVNTVGEADIVSVATGVITTVNAAASSDIVTIISTSVTGAGYFEGKTGIAVNDRVDYNGALLADNGIITALAEDVTRTDINGILTAKNFTNISTAAANETIDNFLAGTTTMAAFKVLIQTAMTASGGSSVGLDTALNDGSKVLVGIIDNEDSGLFLVQNTAAGGGANTLHVSEIELIGLIQGDMFTTAEWAALLI